MSSSSPEKGHAFEKDVFQVLNGMKEKYPHRVTIIPQEEVRLRDGRIKVIDFALEYSLISTRHVHAIECQNREAWHSDIIDKILAIRNHGSHTRFWFVYKEEEFLGPDAKKVFDEHRINFFSFDKLKEHVAEVIAEIAAVDAAQGGNSQTMRERQVVDRAESTVIPEIPRRTGLGISPQLHFAPEPLDSLLYANLSPQEKQRVQALLQKRLRQQ